VCPTVHHQLARIGGVGVAGQATKFKSLRNTDTDLGIYECTCELKEEQS